MSKRYRKWAYIAQLNAVALLFLGLGLAWHDAHGSGYQMLGHVFRAEAVPGLVWTNGQDDIVFSITPWWFVAGIPLGALGLGIRALVGLVLEGFDLTPQRFLVAVLSLCIGVGMAWLVVSQTPFLAVGVLLGGMALLTLFAALGVEVAFPGSRYDAQHLAHLPPDHPQRVKYGFTRQCPSCQAYNDPQAKWCWHCGLALFTD